MSPNLQLPYLPQEIITTIISKLPVKSLLQFKCVSKTWLSLISSPHFAKLHLLQLKQNNSAISRVFLSTFQSFDPQTFSDGNGTATFMEHNPIKYVYFVGSCDGLIFVGSYEGSICSRDYFDYKHLFVFNPTTQQAREIPTPNSTKKGLYFGGFGYDSKIDDYKIVRGVIFNFYYDGFCIEIFRLKGNSWRTIQTKHWCGDLFPKNARILRDYFRGESVFLNGVLHWPTATRDPIGNGIIRFDLVEERFLDKISIPNDIGYLFNLIVIDESLCFYNKDGGLRTFSVWKMMNYGDENSWTRVYQINTNNFPVGPYGFLHVTKNGQILFDIDRETGYMILHNPVDGEIKQINEEGDGHVTKTVYIESLVSPNIAD